VPTDPFITRHINTNRFSFSLISVTDQNQKFTKSFKNIHGTLAQFRAIPAPIHTKFIRIPQIHYRIQLTETNRNRIHTNSMESHAVLRDSDWIFIIEPKHLQFEHEHVAGGSALQVRSRGSYQRRRGRRREGLQQFESEEEEEGEITLPVKILSQRSQETVQSPNQNTGNTQTLSYLFTNHHRFRTTRIHSQFELFGPKTLTLTQKNLKKSKESFRTHHWCESKYFLIVSNTFNQRNTKDPNSPSRNQTQRFSPFQRLEPFVLDGFVLRTRTWAVQA